MIQRFSSRSNVFTAKPITNGCEFIWQTSLDLSNFKFMAVHDFYTTSWPNDGKKLSHLSSNLTDASECNHDGHIYTWLKKPVPRLEGVSVKSSIENNIFLEFHLLDRDFTDEVIFYAKNLKYSDNLEVEIIVEFSNIDTSLST